MGSKDLSGVKRVPLDMTARDKGKGGPDNCHTTSFSPSKVVHYFPNFRSYFGMEYEQPWNMGKIFLESMHLCIYVSEDSMYPCIYVSMDLCIYVSMYLWIYVSLYLGIYVSMYL